MEGHRACQPGSDPPNSREALGWPVLREDLVKDLFDTRVLLAVTLLLKVGITLALLRGRLKATSFLRSSTVLASSRSSRVRLYSLGIKGADKDGNIVVRSFSTRSVSVVLAFCQSLYSEIGSLGRWAMEMSSFLASLSCRWPV